MKSKVKIEREIQKRRGEEKAQERWQMVEKADWVAPVAILPIFVVKKKTHILKNVTKNH